MSNNTVCAGIIHLVRTDLTLLQGSNQASNFPLLQMKLLREKLGLILRDPYRWIQREPFPSHPPIILIPFQRDIIMLIKIRELQQFDVTVTAGT